MDLDEPQTKNPLATFATKPVGITFESQEEGEQILLLLRPHVATLIPAILVTIFLILVPIILNSFLLAFNLEITFLTSGQSFLLSIFWYLVVFAYAFYRFLFWYFDIYILTNERIVDFDFRGVLNKEIAFATLDHIEDISPKTRGFFGTLFNFGDVFVQTAGTTPEFNFRRVPNPDLVAQKILEQVRGEEEEASGDANK